MELNILLIHILCFYSCSCHYGNNWTREWSETLTIRKSEELQKPNRLLDPRRVQQFWICSDAECSPWHSQYKHQSYWRSKYEINWYRFSTV